MFLDHKIMKKIRLLFAVLLIVFYTPALQTKAAEFNGKLYSTSAVLMDGESGRVLYGKKEMEKMANASTTKIMTMIVTLEHCDLNETVEVSSYAASMPSVKCNIRKGEKYKLYDLACSMMLESHNDSAVAIAEHVAGSVEEFSKLMNEKAKEIGCEDTYFITPNGLDANVVLEDGSNTFHGTTAKDLARIMSYCILRSPKKKEFLAITQTQSHSFCDSTGKRQFICRNHNSLFQMRSGVISGKTGFTNKAGYCYVGAIESDGRIFIVALLACGWPSHKTYKWSDAQKLFLYGEKNYHKASFKNISFPEHCFDELEVYSKKQKKRIYIPLSIENKEMSENVLVKEGEELRIDMARIFSMQAPVKKGERIGEINYYVGDEVFANIPLYSSGNAYEKTEKKIFQ